MGKRLELQTLLENLLGSEYVYFQPPPSAEMQYPCIVYSVDDIATVFADNTPYLHHYRYSLKVIDTDPDSLIPAKVADLPLCLFERHYTADNLDHYVYNLYY